MGAATHVNSMSRSDDEDSFKVTITQISSHHDSESTIDRKSIFGDLSPLSPFSPTLDILTSSQKSTDNTANNFDPMFKKRKI